VVDPLVRTLYYESPVALISFVGPKRGVSFHGAFLECTVYIVPRCADKGLGPNRDLFKYIEDEFYWRTV